MPYAFGLLYFLLLMPYVAIMHPLAVVWITGIFVGAALVVGFLIGIVAAKMVSLSSISVKVLSVAMAMVFDLAVFGWGLVKATVDRRRYLMKSISVSVLTLAAICRLAWYRFICCCRLTTAAAVSVDSRLSVD